MISSFVKYAYDRVVLSWDESPMSCHPAYEYYHLFEKPLISLFSCKTRQPSLGDNSLCLLAN